MTADGRFAGWTITEALRRSVDSRLIKNWTKAEHALCRHGKPGRGILSAGIGASREAEAAAASYRERRRIYGILHRAREEACISARSEFMRHLRSGKLVALGRRGGPTPEPHSIPSSAWKELRIVHLKRSTVEERTEHKVHIHDVRIFPVLASASAVAHLTGRALAAVCREFIFNDPQVCVVRTLAAQAGSQETSFGFSWEGLESVWPLDLENYHSVNGALRSSKQMALQALVERLIAERFSRLINLLYRQELLAFGIPEAGGAAVEIPHSIWRRERIYLDLKNGDLFEAKKRERSFWDRGPESAQCVGLIDQSKERSKASERKGDALFRAIVLRQPSSVSHVKPQLSDPVPPRTTEPKRGNKKKAIATLEGREAAFKACTDWLAELMEESPEERSETSANLWRMAKARWPLLTNNNYHRARATAASRTGAIVWRSAGAPAKTTK